MLKSDYDKTCQVLRLLLPHGTTICYPNPVKASRLISLLMLLQTHGRLTARELSERLEVSPRTIYRDIDALSAAGVPVYTDRGPGGGCALLENYRTNLTGLTTDEVHALFMFAAPLSGPKNRLSPPCSS